MIKNVTMYLILVVLCKSSLFGSFKVSYLNENINYENIKEVINKNFTPISSYHTFGIRKNVWLKVSITNNSNESYENFLSLSNLHIMEKVHFYTIDNNQLIKENKSWDKYTNFNTAHRIGKSLLYKNHLKQKQSIDVYIYITAKSNIYFELYNGKLQEVISSINNSTLVLLILSGMLLSLGIFYLFFWLFTPNKEYLYYVIFVFSMTIWSFYINGGFAHHLDVFYIGPYVNSFIYLFPVWMILFFKEIFPKEVLPKVFYFILNIITLLIFFIVFLYFIGLSSFFPHFSVSTYGIFFYLLGMTAILLLSIIIVIKKIPYSKNFLIAFSANFFCSIISILFYLGLISYNSFTFHAVLIGGTIEAILLSILLSSKLKEVYKEKEYAIELAKTKDLKIKTMNDTISFISHQWRQPLSQVNSAVFAIDSELLKSEVKNNTIEKKLTEIEKMTKHMSTTIDDFRLIYSSINKKEQVQLSEPIKKSLDKINYILEDNKIEVILKLDETIVFDCYENDLIQVLLVLFNNAKDAFIYKKHNKKITIVLQRLGNNITLEVIDNAGGIKKELIHRIFEPYFSTKDKHQGMGIGLYMAKLIVENRLDGTLSVLNQDKGACFSLTFNIKENINIKNRDIKS